MNTRISAAKRSKRRSAPNTVNGTVPPRRLLNAKRRPREYLTVKEVGKLVEGARSRGRYGRRDATMILVAYRHGLRASELCALRWDQVDPERGLVHVRRLKNGTPARRHASLSRSRSRPGDGTSRRDHDAGGARRGVDAKRRRRGPFIPAAEITDSSWPGLSRPSQGDCAAIVRTPPSRRLARRKAAHFPPLPEEGNQLCRVDGRDKPGHDGGQYFWRLVSFISAAPRRR